MRRKATFRASATKRRDDDWGGEEVALSNSQAKRDEVPESGVKRDNEVDTR